MTEAQLVLFTRLMSVRAALEKVDELLLNFPAVQFNDRCRKELDGIYHKLGQMERTNEKRAA